MSPLAAPGRLIASIAIAGLLLTKAVSGHPAAAQEPNHPELGSFAQLLSALDSGAISLDELRALGLSVFTTPFQRADGYGDGPFDPTELDPGLPGQRPTLQGNGLLLRVNGLDAQSCNECHSLVSHATRPPTLGIGGVGGSVTNAVILPGVIDVADSSDDRVVFRSGHAPSLPLEPDGVADVSGRFANPPFLFGGGGVELLAREMTEDLQRLLGIARAAPPGQVTPLVSHAVDFGYLLTQEGGAVDLSFVEGVGPAEPDSVPAEDVLVVRPFGRKGENFSMRDFDRGAMRFHFGIEPVEVVDPDGRGGVDVDGDGVAEEASVAEMTALHVFDVTNPPPVGGPRSRTEREGARIFRAIGCASCHQPALVTRSRTLPLAHPEVPEDPRANVYLEIDLVRVGFRAVRGAGVRVALYADLKRHDMGPRLAETLEGAGRENRMFTTARLWGVADTAPYLHDGRAGSLAEAIDAHGGEAQDARDAWAELSEGDRRSVLAFLATLRTPAQPNEELVPMVRQRLDAIRARLSRPR